MPLAIASNFVDMAINHDQLFKELLTTFFIEFLELFFPAVVEYLEPDSISFVDKELFTNITSGRKKILDIVALAKFRGEDSTFLIHVENESSSKANFNRRFFKYFCTLFLKYDAPIYPIVVFSYDSPLRIDVSSFTVDFPDKRVLAFDYEIVQLNQFDWRDFVENRNPVAAALMSKMNIAQKDRSKVKLECLRLLVSLELDPARMELISGFVDTYLNLDAIEEQAFQSQLGTINLEEQQQIMQLTTSWKEQGRQEGKVSTILRQLNRKFGSLDSAITDKISALNSEKLDSLTEELLDFQSFEDLERFLGNC